MVNEKHDPRRDLDFVDVVVSDRVEVCVVLDIPYLSFADPDQSPNPLVESCAIS